MLREAPGNRHWLRVAGSGTSPGVMVRRSLLVGGLALAAACATPGPTRPAPTAPSNPRAGASIDGDLDVATPASVGLDPHKLVELTDWIRATDAPIFSVLVSESIATTRTT